jgi:hypothetical protein
VGEIDLPVETFSGNSQRTEMMGDSG